MSGAVNFEEPSAHGRHGQRCQQEGVADANKGWYPSIQGEGKRQAGFWSMQAILTEEMDECLCLYPLPWNAHSKLVPMPHEDLQPAASILEQAKHC